MQDTKNYIIRKARMNDLGTIQDLMLALYLSDRKHDPFFDSLNPEEGSEEEYTKRIRGGNALCLVAELNREIIGCLTGLLQVDPDERPVKRTRLEKLFVKEEWRGRGAGAALVEAFVQWSKDKGVERILVRTYATNEGATHLYERLGFRPYIVALVLPVSK